MQIIIITTYAIFVIMTTIFNDFVLAPRYESAIASASTASSVPARFLIMVLQNFAAAAHDDVNRALLLTICRRCICSNGGPSRSRRSTGLSSRLIGSVVFTAAFAVSLCNTLCAVLWRISTPQRNLGSFCLCQLGSLTYSGFVRHSVMFAAACGVRLSL